VSGSLQFIIPTNPQLVNTAILLLVIYVVSGLIFVKGLKHAVFLLVPYVLIFTLLEGGTRIWIAYFTKPSEQLLSAEQLRSPEDLGKETVYVPHHYTLYNLRPHLSTDKGTVHNRLGLRDYREFGSKDRTIRVVFIGGSTTYTIAIKDNKKIFSYGLEQRLNEYYHDKFTDYKIQVINAGMGGATSAENLLRLIFFCVRYFP